MTTKMLYWQAQVIAVILLNCFITNMANGQFVDPELIDSSENLLRTDSMTYIDNLTDLDSTLVLDSLDILDSLNLHLRKRNISRPINYNHMLKAMTHIPVRSWPIKDEANKRYIGPTAADFLKYFELGDGEDIETVDADGILMASVQGLALKLRELEIENAELRRSHEEMRQRFIRMQQQFEFMLRRLGQ